MTPVQPQRSSSSSSEATPDSSLSSNSLTPPTFRRLFNRGHSLSILPTVPELSEKEKVAVSDRGCTRDAEKTFSVVTKRQPLIFIQVPMDKFVGNCINIPVVTFKIWDKKVLSAVLTSAVKTDFSDRKIQNVINDIFVNCLNYSSIIKRIAMASDLLSGSNEYVFLNDFTQPSSPLNFWDKYEKLRLQSRTKFNFLYELMGRQEAYTILRQAVESRGKKIKDRFRSQINILACFEKKKQSFFNCSILFPNASDPSLLRIASIPPFAQNYKEFVETFRSFLSNGPFPKRSIRFNNECLIIPDYTQLGLEDSEREEYFVKWLISEFQRKMNIGLAPDPKAQIQSFAMTPNLDPKFVKNKLRPLIIKCLKKEFKRDVSADDFGKKLDSFFGHFQKETADFSMQLRPFSDFLGTYLKNCFQFQKRNWEEVSEILISWYGRLYQLKDKHVSIPTLPLLQSIGYPSYAICGLFLNGIGQPKQLFSESSSYRLVLNRDEIGSYDIHIKKSCFDSTHVKWFNVVYNQSIKAKILIHWKVSGMLDSFHYSYSLSSHDAQFSADCNENERLIILDQLSLAFHNVKEAGFNGTVLFGSKP